ncbi:unnamed protein product [Darwinula stevensoni]|uniref:Uncharacterized protein n=1 Tax=Darwinula stevensoni TaxID=69355 RepID=A0A7R8X3S9_9CRUS|nr:unnamed protein product [Darwinula stevensoni]CAG0882688.1 unnamed protein product [Darwinula stevensoni]
MLMALVEPTGVQTEPNLRYYGNYGEAAPEGEALGNGEEASEALYMALLGMCKLTPEGCDSYIETDDKEDA